VSFKFFYGWTPFVCRCARRGASARIGRESDGGSGGEEEDEDEDEDEDEQSGRQASKGAR
jgi:hypothetical protein